MLSMEIPSSRLVPFPANSWLVNIERRLAPISNAKSRRQFGEFENAPGNNIELDFTGAAFSRVCSRPQPLTRQIKFLDTKLCFLPTELGVPMISRGNLYLR